MVTVSVRIMEVVVALVLIIEGLEALVGTTVVGSSVVVGSAVDVEISTTKTDTY